MNDFFEELSNCINPHVLIEIEKTAYDAKIAIIEDDESSKSRPFIIKGLDKEKTIVIKADYMKCIYHSRTKCNIISIMLNPNKEHLFQFCDYIIVTKIDDDICCLFLENKDNPESKNKIIIHKLEKSKHFWDYFLSLLFYYNNDYRTYKFSYFYVLSSLKYNNAKMFKKIGKYETMNIFNNQIIKIPQLDVNIKRIINK